MVLALPSSQSIRLQVHQRMLGAGLLALVCGCPGLAAQAATALKPPTASALKQPVARTLVKSGVPNQFTTPTLVATGFGKIPASFTTVPLVARGYGQVPSALTTPVLVARGYGNLPAQFTTKPLIVALPGQSGKPR
jgi:hypothetical protein